jgi:hypothetical protein
LAQKSVRSSSWLFLYLSSITPNSSANTSHCFLSGTLRNPSRILLFFWNLWSFDLPLVRFEIQLSKSKCLVFYTLYLNWLNCIICITVQWFCEFLWTVIELWTLKDQLYFSTLAHEEQKYSIFMFLSKWK